MELLLKYFDEFTEVQSCQFAALQDLYTDWNSKINVISRKDIYNFYEHHVLHSLAIAARYEFLPGMEILDLGCGGGFPGIPLAIFFPKTQFYLVDCIQKKLRVVAEIARNIGLKNIITQHTRAEDIKNRKFDTVISRAVAPLEDLWKWSRPILKKNIRSDDREEIPNGLICLKGGDLTTEIYKSGLKPYIWEIIKLFNEKYFSQKYLLYVPLKGK